MKRTQLIATALLGAAISAQPAAAYPLTTTGHTLASPQLTADLLNEIARYSRNNGGCSFLFSARMEVVPSPPALTQRGGHLEHWSINACAARQHFRIAMWLSPQGGTDYAITPTTDRLPLTLP